MPRSCCATPYHSDRGSLPVSRCRSALDLHPKIHNSKHRRGHESISTSLRHGIYYEALTILTEGLIGMPIH